MTTAEFLSILKAKGATIIPVKNKDSISIVNTHLQNIKAAMLPSFLFSLYQETFGIYLGSGYIFGPTEIERGITYPIPSIVDINKTLSGNKNLYGKTIFGKNDLFFFATDALNNCFMLDNISLNIIKKYENPFNAIHDCLIIGKI